MSHVTTMMFTTTPPNHPADRTRLFPSLEAAGPAALGGGAVFEVAVRFDVRNRRVEPLPPDRPGPWLVWTTPGQAHADDSVTARGVIPPELYTGRITTRPLPARV